MALEPFLPAVKSDKKKTEPEKPTTSEMKSDNSVNDGDLKMQLLEMPNSPENLSPRSEPYSPQEELKIETDQEMPKETL